MTDNEYLKIFPPWFQEISYWSQFFIMMSATRTALNDVLIKKFPDDIVSVDTVCHILSNSGILKALEEGQVRKIFDMQFMNEETRKAIWQMIQPDDEIMEELKTASLEDWLESFQEAAEDEDGEI